mmetsp:Transcript_10432/g.34309  ORF Transcript_10432/g.34309 Transcript_10432/m.34309 type:complete len:533 (-) Transcript_10432:44-1642(-)
MAPLPKAPAPSEDKRAKDYGGQYNGGWRTVGSQATFDPGFASSSETQTSTQRSASEVMTVSVFAPVTDEAAEGEAEGEEEEWELAYEFELVRDAARATKIVRTANGPHAGERTWVKVRRHDELPLMPPRAKLEFAHRGTVVEATMKPDLFAVKDASQTIPAHERVIERQFGSLKRDGLAVQLRFRVAAGAPSEERGRCAQTGRFYLYQPVDGAVTVDNAVRDVEDEPAADMALDERKLAHRVGRAPAIWEFRPPTVDSHMYHPDHPNRIAWDWRGEERCRAEQQAIMKETRMYGQRSATEALDKRLRALQRETALTAARVRELRLVIAATEEKGEEHRISEEEIMAAKEAATGDLQSGLSFQDRQRLDAAKGAAGAGLGGGWAERKPIGDGVSPLMYKLGLSDEDVDMTDCIGLTRAAISRKLTEAMRLHRMATDAEAEMKEDVYDRRRFDTFESGFETRDVMENGVRRAHMTARLGRTVAREDIEDSMKIPFLDRPRAIGYDPDAKPGGKLNPTHLLEHQPFEACPRDQQP